MNVRAERGVRSWGWLFPALWVALILLSSSVPEISTPGRFFARDKIIHLAEYGVLSALVAAGLAELVSWRRSRRVLAAIGVCVLLGALDEVYQQTVAGREADLMDFVSDGVGAAVGQLLLLVIRDRRGRS